MITVARAKAVRIESELARRGIRLKRAGRELVGPCPVCGGTDRFAIHLTKQIWNCRHCARGGDVIDLVQHLDGMSVIEAVKVLTGSGAPARAAATAHSTTRSTAHGEERDTLEAADRIWRQSNGIFRSPGEIYFSQRGLDLDEAPDAGGLRWHPKCPWEGTIRPCVVARFTDALTNEPRGIWRRPVDGGKPKSLGPSRGCVIRLWPDENVTTGLVIGEGVETVLSAALHFTCRGTLLRPAWATSSAVHLENFPILSGIEALTILADHDVNGRGQEAAERCAKRWVEAGREVTKFTPRATWRLQRRDQSGTAAMIEMNEFAAEELRENPSPEWDKFMYDDMNGGGSDGESRRAIPLVAFDEVTLGRKRRYLVKGIIPRVGLTVAWGPPKCGKSFWTFDLMMHVALGWEYRGRRVHPGAVVYCAFEGQIGMEARIEAFRHRPLTDHPDKVPFYLVPVTLDLVRDHKALIAAIKNKLGIENPVAVALDTLNRSMKGSESSDEDMTAYVNAADAIRAAFDCAVVIVHHCGIDGSRPRGHTSLTGTADAQLAVKRDVLNNVVVTVECMKDGPEGETITSHLEVVEVGNDEDGEPITSCIVVEADAAGVPRKTPQLSPVPQAGLKALHDCLADQGRPAPPSGHIPTGVQTVTLEEWRHMLDVTGIINRDGSYREQFRRIRVTLKNAGVIGIWEDFVWAVT